MKEKKPEVITSIVIKEKDLEFACTGMPFKIANATVHSNLFVLLFEDEYFSGVRDFLAEPGGTLSITLGEELLEIKGRLNFRTSVDILVYSNQLRITPSLEDKISEIRESVTLDSFIRKHAHETYEIVVEGEQYRVSVADIFNSIMASDREFARLCSSDAICGIKTSHFYYIVHKYFIENPLNSDISIPSSIKQRLSDMKSYKLVDFQAVGVLEATVDTLHRNIQIDSELEKAILSGMPRDMDALHQAVYIYIKMCQLLSYDEEFYAMNQKGAVADKHRDINYIKNITLENNKVVCFEFNLIFGHLIDKLGIKFKTTYEKGGEEFYGTGHANMLFRSGKFLIAADSTNMILKGDLLYAKIGAPLTGLSCMNLNKETKIEFNKIVRDVYSKMNRSNQFGDLEFEESVKEYKALHNGTLQLGKDVTNLFEIFKNKVQACTLEGIDSLSYILHLRRILFEEGLKNDNIIVTIVREATSNNSYKPLAVVAYNPFGFGESPDDSQYFFVTKENRFIPVSREAIQVYFEAQAIDYVEQGSPKIPGIVDVEVVQDANESQKIK